MTSHAFALSRMALGLYLLVHFLGLWPDAVELFSHAGMLPDARLSPTFRVFPGWFWLSDAPWMVHAVMAAGTLLAGGLVVGVRRRWVAFLLWTLWASLFNRNVLISNPSIPFVGLSLLWMAALPSGEAWSRDPARPDFRVPAWAQQALLLVLMAGYTVSGLHKLGSPSWLDGRALTFVLHLPLARDSALREGVLALPAFVHAGMTYLALACEVLALPLTLFRPTQRPIWLLLTGMNLGILLLVDFADLTFGVLLVHLLCLQRSWWSPPDAAAAPPTLFFDGVCNLCDGAVRFVLTEDVDARFRFAPLQGESAAALALPEVADLSTMVLREGDRTYTRSDAVLHVALGLGGIWHALARLALWLPRPLRDGVYGFVARRRYALFGKKDACRIPTPAERARFLP